MKPTSYVLSILVVAACIAGFYWKYSSLYTSLNGEELSIFWGATVYVAVVAIGVGRYFVWGLLTGVMTGVVAWYVFSALMPEHQTAMILGCGLVYALLFLISSMVQENQKAKTQSQIETMGAKLQHIVETATS